MPFRIALLKLNSQEAAQHMSERQHEQALVIAMEAVKEGQDLFKPQPDLRLFPLFLLAAQVLPSSLPLPSCPVDGVCCHVIWCHVTMPTGRCGHWLVCMPGDPHTAAVRSA